MSTNMYKPKNYTEEQFIQAVKDSKSIAQVLSKLKIIGAGGNYSTCKKRIKRLNLDTSHFLGQGWNKGNTPNPPRPIEDYLSNKFPIQSHKFRIRLIKEGYFPYQCCKCKLKEWLGQPIPLELEHKDGNHDNNSLENLEILCPNCHAQTSTYRGKNQKRRVA